MAGFTALIVAVVLGLLNIFIYLVILTLPITFITLGAVFISHQCIDYNIM
jgi:uncharacterized membrane protein YvlD (DUF360 family)